ncbi:MAG: PfkB family carbohydrate kinase, partial [Actinobacteria bacterium]|nr:PfkB family carbohydrate kinase [Actinomycetota bacterium]
MKSNPILIIGSSNYDIFLEMPHIPTIGETILVNNFFTNFGGKGANQAVVIRKLGGEVKLLTCLGDDIFGKLILKNFKGYKIDLKLIKVIKNQNNGIAIVNLDSKGKNNIA